MVAHNKGSGPFLNGPRRREAEVSHYVQSTTDLKRHGPKLNSASKWIGIKVGNPGRGLLGPGPGKTGFWEPLLGTPGCHQVKPAIYMPFLL